MHRHMALSAPADDLPATMDVYTFGEPVTVDILSLIGYDVSSRWNLRECDVSASNVTGCDQLVNPVLVLPTPTNQQPHNLLLICLLHILEFVVFLLCAGW